MKKVLSTLFLLSTLSFAGFGQIQYTGCNNLIPGDFPFTLNSSGTVGARNTYTSALPGTSCGAGVCAFRVIWENNRWEIQLTNNGGSNWILLYYNESASTPNPPGCSLGDWIDGGANCNSLCMEGLWTGSVQNTINVCSMTASISSITNVSCNGEATGSMTATVSGGAPNYTYLWSNGSTTSNTPSTTNTVISLVAGTYTLTVSDDNGCTATTSGTTTQSPVLTLTTTATNVSCFGGTNGAIDLTVSGGVPSYYYQWTGGASTQDRTGLAAGMYTVTVGDGNGCTKTTSVTITHPSALSLTPSSQTNVACNEGLTGAAMVNATGGAGGYTYDWDPGTPTGDGTASVTGLSAGTWTCIVTDANSCTASQSITITEPPALSLTPSSQTNVSCYGGLNGAAAVNAATGGAGGYTYNWTPGNPTGDGTTGVTGLSAGTWTCVVTDANSCTASQSFTITQPAMPIGGTTVTTNVTCNGLTNGAINLTPTGGSGPYTFNWGGGITTEDRTDLPAGAYTVTVTDSNSCTGSVSAIVAEPQVLQILINSYTDSICVGLNTAEIDLELSGGTAPYFYFWDDGTVTQDRGGLSAGSYSVTVTDGNGCTDTHTVIINSYELNVEIELVQAISCEGGSNGILGSNVVGGSAPFTYLWSTSYILSNHPGLFSGQYRLTVTDNKGCTDLALYQLADGAPSVQPVVNQLEYCPGTTLAEVDVTGENLSWYEDMYQHYWLPDTTHIVSGTYFVKQNLNGCESELLEVTFDADDEELPQISCSSGDVLLDGEQQIILENSDWVIASDNCTITSIMANPAILGENHAGTTVPVIWTVTDQSGNTAVCTSQIAVSGLPVGWSSTEDGINCEGGSNATYDFDSDVFELTSNGCYNTNNSSSDAMAFAGSTLCGNGYIIARVDDIKGDVLGWAGITMRESTTAGSKKVQLSLNPGYQIIKREIRSITGGATQTLQSPGQNRRWLKIQRTGNQFTGFASNNGMVWQPILAVNLTMGDCIQVGLALSNYSMGGSSGAEFSNVEIFSSNLVQPGLLPVNAEVQNKTSLYPNPNDGQFILELSSWIGQNLSIDIVNIQGQVVKSIDRYSVSRDRLEITLPQISPGLYHVILKSEVQNPEILKLLITE